MNAVLDARGSSDFLLDQLEFGSVLYFVLFQAAKSSFEHSTGGEPSISRKVSTDPSSFCVVDIWVFYVRA